MLDVSAFLLFFRYIVRIYVY